MGIPSTTSANALVISDYTAYNMGKKGLKITSQFLSSYLKTFNEHSLEVKEKILSRRVHGIGVTVQNLSAVILGLIIFAAALFVDYNIIHEFWVRMLSNEFMEVPAALALSVEMKSLQVLFATMSIHYFFSHIGYAGRMAYVVFVFLLTVSMIGGVGLLYAQTSMPVQETSQTIQKFAESLGIDSTEQSQSSEELMKPYKEYVWLSALSVLFFIVASIGAMGLHTATRGFAGITGGALYDTNREANRNNRYRDELAQVRKDVKRLKEVGSESFMQGKVADFQASYSIGLIDGRHSQATCEQLLNYLDDAIKNLTTA
jgi:hypothetical protein